MFREISPRGVASTARATNSTSLTRKGMTMHNDTIDISMLAQETYRYLKALWDDPVMQKFDDILFKLRVEDIVKDVLKRYHLI